MKYFITGEQLKKELMDLGLSKGMRVCLQVSDAFAQEVIGGYQTILTTIMKIVTQKGCLIIPSFDFSNLDPSCQKDIPYEMWEKLRQSMPGYQTQLSPSNDLATQFLKNDNVMRSQHPIYSFAYWGNYKDIWLESNLDYPLSFYSSLYPLNKKNACNLLLGIKKEDSVLLEAIAQMIPTGQTYVQRAKVYRSSFKKFLNLGLSSTQKEECLNHCSIIEKEWNHQSIKMLSTDIKSDKTEEMDSNVSIMSLSNR